MQSWNTVANGAAMSGRSAAEAEEKIAFDVGCPNCHSHIRLVRRVTPAEQTLVIHVLCNDCRRAITVTHFLPTTTAARPMAKEFPTTRWFSASSSTTA
jgi:hypothetical protein